MVVIEKAQETFVESAIVFVNEFELHDEFEEKYGVPIDEWDHSKTDDEVIKELLSESRFIWTYRYDEMVEGFYINRINRDELEGVLIRLDRDILME